MLLSNPTGMDPPGGARALTPRVQSCLGRKDAGSHSPSGFQLLHSEADEPWERGCQGCSAAAGFGGREKKNQCLLLWETLANESLAGSGSLAGVICNCRVPADNKGPLTSDFWPPALFFRAVCRNQAVPGGSVSTERGCQQDACRMAASPAQAQRVLVLTRV